MARPHPSDDLSIPPYRPRPASPHVHQPSPSAPPRRPSRTPQLYTGHRPHDRLAQYDIVKTIGEGSFGKVKLAIHRVTGQYVALKIISRRNLTNRDMAGRVEREIAYLSLLRHPHIIRLFSVINQEKEIVMVIEYAEGELFDYLVKNGKMAENAARRFFQQIICAVEYCHRHKIVHRDLKPENLLLDNNLNVKIADFGLSNIMTDGNFLKTSCGSPNYAAPEVISGKLYAGPEVDVWSCGVILFVLLCGKLPFDDELIPNLFKKISQGKFSIPSYISPDAKDLISRMLIVNPVQRITIQDIRKHPWFVKDLPSYLEPPKEEFFDTGVDVTKLPPLAELERGPAEKLQGEVHDAIVGKLGSKMGYAKDEVQDALTKDEPNTIKDAYMIVRENQMMIPQLSNAKNDGFIAQSPPAWDSFLPSSPPPFHPHSPHPHLTTPSRTASPLALNPHGLGITHVEDNLPPSSLSSQSPASSISILPSSMPAYHKDYMAGAPVSLNPNNPSSRFRPFPSAASSNTSQQPPKRPRQTKWQFGIRSRNAPLEAVGCIYRALKRLGAEWTVEEPEPPISPRSGSPGSSDSEDEDEEEDVQEEGKPKDPWLINARWKKFAPTRPWKDGDELREEDYVYIHLTIQLYQVEAENYLVDFKCAGYERCKPSRPEDSERGEDGGRNASRDREECGGRRKKKVGFQELLGGDEGGERVRGGEEEDGEGRTGGEGMQANSPFPFLDVAGRLIVALAEAGAD